MTSCSQLLASANIASKECVYQQYDYSVQVNTVQGPGGDAALLRVKGTPAGLAVTIDGNGQYCYLDPFVGGAIAVAEAARNLACVGAEPLALTNCLNFGNPEKTEVYYQLEGVIRGMAAACAGAGCAGRERKRQPLQRNARSTNLSHADGRHDRQAGVSPTERHNGFQAHEGRRHRLARPADRPLRRQRVPGTIHGMVTGHAPPIDLDMEARVQAVCRQSHSRRPGQQRARLLAGRPCRHPRGERHRR